MCIWTWRNNSEIVEWHHAHFTTLQPQMNFSQELHLFQTLTNNADSVTDADLDRMQVCVCSID